MTQSKSLPNAASAASTSIPRELTSFIGREHDLASVERLLASARLVTLTGAAGCGKTRLALRVAAEVHPRYADGVHWADLAQVGDPTLVPQVVAKVLHVPEQPGRTTVEGLLEALQEKHLLLVLDNCEHVLRASAQLVETLLARAEVSVLATSREPLYVAGEMRYPVSPLALPLLPLPAEALGQFDAVKLFVERARAILPDFALTRDNAAAVASICRRLDGLPLAIELVSARVNVLAVEQIAVRLDEQLELPLAAPHLVHSHHRTLSAAIDWSYDLLAPQEQVLLRRLSVFTGGSSLAMAEAVCAGDGVQRGEVLELLSALVDKSLLVADTFHRSEARYTLLETIRHYAHEKLVASGEWSALRDRHLQCFLELAEETEPKLSGQYQQLWLSWLEDEHPNIRTALTWSLEHQRSEAGLRIVNALYQYWTIRDYAEEGFAWLERLLTQADERASPLVRAKALAYAAFLAGFRGRTSEQVRYGREAAAIAEAAGDEGKEALSWALSALAHAARAEGDFEAEYSIAKRAIQVRRDLGASYFLGLVLSLYSPTAMALGKYAEARAMLDEGLTLLRQVGNPYRIAQALNYSGDLARCEQQYALAQDAYEATASLLRGIGAARDLASVLQNWGHTCLHLGDIERAQTLFHEGLTLQQEHRNTPGVAECLIGFAALAVTKDMPSTGARLLAAAVAIGGERVATAWPATRMEYEHYLSVVRSRLTESEFQAEQAAGRTLSLEQAIEYARHLTLEAGAPRGPRSGQDDLTVREREVAVLIAQGASNGEIADHLVLSKRTVEKHIANILAKLGFRNRAQIVRWAMEAGLMKSAK